MIEIPRAQTERMDQPGPCWHGGLKGDFRRTALVKCAKGHIAAISGHTIAADGSITPSLICPEPGCDWHVMGKLLGWEAV